MRRIQRSLLIAIREGSLVLRGFWWSAKEAIL